MKRIVKVINDSGKNYYRVQRKKWWQVSWSTYHIDFKLCSAAREYMDMEDTQLFPEWKWFKKRGK